MATLHPARMIRKPAIAIILILSLAFAAVAFAAPKVIGIAAAVVNDVRIKGANASAFNKASLRQRVALADQVRTGAQSRLQLLLLDKSKFTVGANARLTIDRFVYNPDGSGSFSASVAKGAFRFMSGRSGRDKDSSINSPAATIGIRGTIVDGAVGEYAVAIARRERAIGRDVDHDPLTATLVVLRGPGPRTSGGVHVGAADVTGAGVTVKLERPLDAAYVPRAGAPPIGPFRISTQGLVQLGDLILEPRDRMLPPPGSTADLPFPPDDRLPRPGILMRPPAGMIDDGRGPNGGGYDGYDGYRPGVPGLGSIPELPRDLPERTPRQMTGSTHPSPTPTSTPPQTRTPSTTQPPPSTPAPTPTPTPTPTQTQTITRTQPPPSTQVQTQQTTADNVPATADAAAQDAQTATSGPLNDPNY